MFILGGYKVGSHRDSVISGTGFTAQVVFGLRRVILGQDDMNDDVWVVFFFFLHECADGSFRTGGLIASPRCSDEP